MGFSSPGPVFCRAGNEIATSAPLEPFIGLGLKGLPGRKSSLGRTGSATKGLFFHRGHKSDLIRTERFEVTLMREHLELVSVKTGDGSDKLRYGELGVPDYLY